MVPVDVACALIERDGRLLVARRPAAKAQGRKWEFPGGKVESGEDPRCALAREITEELRVDVVVGRALDPSVCDYGTIAIRLLPFVCRIEEGDPAPVEHEEVRWCTVAEAAELDLAAADRPVLARYAELSVVPARNTETGVKCPESRHPRG